MKPFIREALLLGGFYFFISYIIAYFAGNSAWLWNLGFITIVLLAVIVLVFKDSFAWLNAFWKRFPKLSLYLAALGFIKYFSIIFGDIPGKVDGHLFATATDVDWYQCYLEAYIPVYIFVFWVVFWIALFTATYFAFFSDIKLVKFVEVKVADKEQPKTSSKSEKTKEKKAGKKQTKRK